jgi:hypothetical protein
MEQRLKERMREFGEMKVRRSVMKEWEEQRDFMEGEMISKILEFNMKVREEGDKLEETGKCELSSIREEIDRETKERSKSDNELLEAVNEFLFKLSYQ